MDRFIGDPTVFSMNGVQILVAAMAKMGFDRTMGRGEDGLQSFPHQIEVIQVETMTGDEEIGTERQIVGWVKCPFTNDVEVHCIFKVRKVMCGMRNDPFSGWVAASVKTQYTYGGRDHAKLITFKNRSSSYGMIPEVERAEDIEPVMA